MLIFKSKKGLEILSALKKQSRETLLEQRQKEKAMFEKIVFESSSASDIGEADLDTLASLIKNVEGYCGGAFPGGEKLENALSDILSQEHIQHLRVL